MHENRNLFLFLIEINNMHSTKHILPIPGPVFGAGAAVIVYILQKGRGSFAKRQFHVAV